MLSRFIKKGERKLAKEFNLIKIIQDIKKIKHACDEHGKHMSCRPRDPIDIDNSTSSDENP